MNKKTGTRILIVIVAALWGYNIYRTVENMQSQQELVELEETANYSFSPMIFNKDSFELELPLEDPFLRDGRQWTYTNSSSQSSAFVDNTGKRNNTQPKQEPDPPQPTLEWPELTYNGYLSDPEKNPIPLCLIKINGRTHRIRIGETKENIHVLQADKNQVTISFQDETRIIEK